MIRPTLRRLLMLASLTLVAALAPACVIETQESCVEECYYTEYCDYSGCYEEQLCECVVYDAPYYDVECWEDRDCGRGYGCFDGWCEPLPPTRPQPNAYLCDPCDSAADCAEPDALCIEISDAERVCGRACERDADCPRGFECLDVSQQAGVSDQCVPRPRAADATLTCTAPEPEPEPEPEPAACSTDADCEGAICVQGACAPAECARSIDCGPEDAAICVGGHCRDACATHAECAEGQRCVQPGFCEASF